MLCQLLVANLMFCCLQTRSQLELEIKRRENLQSELNVINRAKDETVSITTTLNN